MCHGQLIVNKKVHNAKRRPSNGSFFTVWPSSNRQCSRLFTVGMRFCHATTNLRERQLSLVVSNKTRTTTTTTTIISIRICWIPYHSQSTQYTFTMAHESDSHSDPAEDHNVPNNGEQDDQSKEPTPHGDNGATTTSSSSGRRRKRKRKRKTTEPSTTDETTNTAVKEDALSRTVFVEGIPYTSTKEQVEQVFTAPSQPPTNEDNDSFPPLQVTEIRLPIWQDSGRLRGYGHVVFATNDDYQTALTMSKKCFLQGRYLTIQPANAPKQSLTNDHNSNNNNNNQDTLQSVTPSRTILLQNLSYEATEEDIDQVLTGLLEQHGNKGRIVANGGIRIVRHNSSKRSRGFAYVELDSTSASRCIYDIAKASPLVLLGRPCRIDYDHGSIRKSFRTATGRLWQKQYGGSHKRHTSRRDDTYHHKRHRTSD